MSDEQQPHRQEPGSGWQPMPHGPEYDAESTAFVQMPPDYAHPDPTDPSGRWDPLAAPGTGYAPPPMNAGHGDPSQGGQWQPAGHDQGMTGHWTTAETDGGYLYGGHHDPHGSGQWPVPAEDQQGHHPPHTGHWPVPGTEEPVDDWPVPRAEEPVDDWPVPAPSDDGTGGPVHTSQWTIPVAGDDGVDETGEYRVDDHPGPAAPPYGGHPDGPQDPQTTAQLRMPFAGPAHQPRAGQQQGHTGQWSVPAADEGVEDSGEYPVQGHPGPAAPPAAATPPRARRPLRMPDGDDRAAASAADPAWPGPAAGDSGEFAVDGQHAGPHTGQHAGQHAGPQVGQHTGPQTPPQGSAVPGERAAVAGDAGWGHGGPAAGDSGEFAVEGHQGAHTPPHGSAVSGGQVPVAGDAGWGHGGPAAGDSGEFAVEGHQGAHTPPHGSAVSGGQVPVAGDVGWGHGGPAAGDSGEVPVDGQHTGPHTPAHGTPHTPPHGIPAHGTPAHGTPAPGPTQEAGWHGEFAGDPFAGDTHAHAPHPGPEDGAAHTEAPADGRDAAEAPAGAAPDGTEPAAPVTAEPVSAAPVTAEPVSAAPVTAEPVSAAPVTAEPVTAEPEPSAEPAVAEPGSAEAVAEPEPAAAEGEFTAAAEAAGAPVPAETPQDAPEAADAPVEPLPDPGPAEGEPPGPAAEQFPSHSEHPLASYVLHVNGADRPVTDVWIGESLLYVLRERLGLAGAKDGCSQGECGACSVQVDGRLVASCLVPAATAAGSEVRTVEGLATDGRPSDVQRALAECGAVQCGFCVPGLAMTVHDLLEGNHSPTDQETRQAISGNLCRCSGYRGVLDAVREVVAEREAAEAAGAAEDGGHDAAHQDPARIPHQAGPHGTTGSGSVNGSGSGRASA
ncbi:2Fe-2S iron-sulfur cluster-binding protein [Streptomyces hygroscopicus]|uniref:2Fe-2S iron-sulfur cluster-binding protein n=1 Tax=Streptomyces hygroscopicus TaxID=1912 RepID=UPI003409DBBB